MRFLSRVSILLLVLSFLSVGIVVAATEVGGVINIPTVWSLENSPYIIISPIQIKPGVELVIEPGVEFYNAGCNYNRMPFADPGFDQVVFDEITLDASESYDPDGFIISYEWSLQNTNGIDEPRLATGVNPTITNLFNGFYDTCLTVTDNQGAKNQSCNLIAAAGFLLYPHDPVPATQTSIEPTCPEIQCPIPMCPEPEVCEEVKPIIKPGFMFSFFHGWFN